VAPAWYSCICAILKINHGAKERLHLAQMKDCFSAISTCQLVEMNIKYNKIQNIFMIKKRKHQNPTKDRASHEAH
jgi:hypothetical protein